MQPPTEDLPGGAPADALIVGAGLAGIVTAIELLEAGRRVLLLDRDTDANLGGLARESFGGILVVDSDEQRRAGVRDTPDLALRDWLAFGAFEPGQETSPWPRRWAETYVYECQEQVYRWLRARGVGFLPLPLWVERGQYAPGNSVPRWHVVWGTGQVLALTLIGQLRQAAARAADRLGREALVLRFGLRVEGLLRNGERVVGCHGRSEADGAPFEARADAVVLAAGGINGSLERVRRHWHADWGRPPQTLLNGSHRYADGTLHDAVQAIGGQVTHLDRQWNYAAGVHHWRPRKPDHGLSLVPPRSALWLDWRGRRIGPVPLVSGYDTRELVTQICRQERAYSWQLLNRRIALKELAVSGAEFNPSIRERSRLGFVRDLLLGNRWLVDELIGHCPDVVVAPTLPELVARMNALQGDDSVDLPTVLDAVQRYDAQIARGPALHNDEQLRRIAHLRQWKGDRLRTCAPRPLLDPQGGPLMAIREFIVSRKSLGGMQTDLDSRVLDAAGEPLPGLYAVGEAAGFGGGGANGLRALEGTFLGGCILTARRAAQAIVR